MVILVINYLALKCMDFIVGFLMCSVDMLDKKGVICRTVVNGSIKNNTSDFRSELPIFIPRIII
jgi:hypothetical protein